MSQKITFATNTGPNTIEYTKLLLKSLKDNLDDQQHEILVFVDNDNDGTVDYLRSIKGDFYDLTIITHNVKPIVGCQRNQNIIVEMAKHDIVSYLQSDMVISKHYDTNLLSVLEPNTILSSTRIEPPLHGQSQQTFTMDFGLDPDQFKYDSFLHYAEECKSNKMLDYFFAPYTFHRDTWIKLGGYDTIFRRSRCDSDLVQRCLHIGINLKQTFAANVYHFTCTTSRGKNWFDKTNLVAQDRVKKQQLADSIELRRFVRKWGNFNHGEELLNKLDMDLVIEDSRAHVQQLAYELEPFVSRVWVESVELKADLLAKCSTEHDLANELFNVKDDEWKDSSHLCNYVDYDQIYQVGTPKDYNILIHINKDSNLQELLNNIHNFSKSLVHYDVGSYDLNGVVIDIQNKQILTQDLSVINPHFDNKLINRL
jgi:hypothetical protein